MTDPHPDPRPFVAPIGLDPKAITGGVPQLSVTSGVPSGHGRVVFSSDALFAQIDALGDMVVALRRSVDELHHLMAAGAVTELVAGARPLVAEAQRMMEAALPALLTAASRAENIRDGIQRSVAEYSLVDQDTVAIMHLAGEQQAWLLGLAGGALVGPVAITAAASLASACAVFGMSPKEIAAAAQSYLKRNGRILTNGATVGAIRETGSDVDGFTDGLVGIPAPLAALGEVTGVTNVKTSAGLVVNGGRLFGLFRETPVVVRRTRSYQFRTPPRSLYDRSTSFPDPHDDAAGEQIRIDKYIQPGQPDRFDVYIAGTVTFDPKTAGEPFDFTSDMRGVAGMPTASAIAVEQAMAKAGVTPVSPVILNGYSQGGLVASTIAATGKYNVKGVVTFGAPSGQVQLPASIPVLSVRNTEDLVPATSGYDVNPNAVVVQRSVFTNSPIPTQWAVPAHRLEYYQQTAAIVDTADSAPVRTILGTLDTFGAGATSVHSSLWVAVRTDGSVRVPPLVPTPSSPLPAREAVAE